MDKKDKSVGTEKVLKFKTRLLMTCRDREYEDGLLKC